MKISDGELQQILRYDLKIPAGEVRELVADSRQAHQSLLKTVLAANINDEQIAKAQAKRLGVPYVNLKDTDLNPNIVGALPHQLASKYRMICFDQTSTSVKLAMADPRDQQARQAARDYFGKTIRRYLTTEAGLLAAIRHYHTTNSKPLPFSSRELLTTILDQARRNGSCDIHFEPKGNDLLIRRRDAGSIKTMATLPIERYHGLISWCKLHSGDSQPSNQKPHDGTFDIIIDNQLYKVMVTTLPTLDGQKMVLRIMPPSNSIPTLQEIGFTQHQAKLTEQTIADGRGLILVAGARANQRQATLTSLMNIASQQPHTTSIAIQHQAHYQLANCSQIQTNQNLSLPQAIHDAILQNPSTLMIDDLGNKLSAQDAIDFALSQHLVIAGSYGQSTLSALRHLMRYPITPALLAASLRLIIIEHSYHQLCKHCRIPFNPTGPLKKALSQQFNLDQDAQLYRAGTGCEKCHDQPPIQTVYQLTMVSPELQQMLATGVDSHTLASQLPVDDDYLKTISKLAASGKISVDTATKLLG